MTVKERISAIEKYRKDLEQIADKEGLTLCELFKKAQKDTKHPNVHDEITLSISRLLKEFSIDPEMWGKGKAKTLDHLVKEIVIGETTLDVTPDGNLVRVVHLSSVDLTYKDLKLVEEMQIFEDGRVRIRQLSATVTEKIMPGENPKEAALRGIQEELDIKNKMKLKKRNYYERELDSPSYPGLRSLYKIQTFSSTIPQNAFLPEGYIEQNDQDGITAYFVWKKAE